MILFQAFDEWKLDLTRYGLTFTEQSDIFYGETTKSFSFPINIDLDAETATNLGLVNLENITGYNIRVDGYLFIDDAFFDAYLLINEVYDKKAELQFFYGSEVLAVFDKKLSELPFPVIDANNDFDAHVEDILNKGYPETSHAFPMYYRPDISQQDKYSNFSGFVNNYEGRPVTNFDQIVEGETRVFNRNVMSPAAYLLEILRVGFASEGKEIRGEMVNDDLLKSTVIIPENFLENYGNTANRVFWQFNFTSEVQSINGQTINVFEQTLDIAAEGFYRLHIKLDFPRGIANYFDLKVNHGNEILYQVFVENQPLNIDKTIFSIIEQAESYEPIVVTLKISEQANTIKGLNRFTFTKDGGDVNVFPNEYSLADFMPDMTFRQFFTEVKKWLALEVTFYENAVYLDYLNTSIRKKTFDDHSDIEDPKKKRILSKRNLFKLYYEESDPVLIDKTGLVYSEQGYNESEIESLEFGFLPMPYGAAKEYFTGLYPEDNSGKMVLGLYNGKVNLRPMLRKAIGPKDLSIVSLYVNFHRYFLQFRANAEQYKDTFEAHVSKKFNLTRGIFKYNKKHLIKRIQKRRIGEKHWKITQESESF